MGMLWVCVVLMAGCSSSESPQGPATLHGLERRADGGYGWWWSDSPEAFHKARFDTDCFAHFTDAATRRTVMPVYFYSQRGECQESDAWARLRVTTDPPEYDGAELVKMVRTEPDTWEKAVSRSKVKK